MEEKSIIGLILILINGIVTYNGLKNYSYLEKFSFKIDEIIIQKDYKRLVTSGFLHGSWMHFGFNMMALYLFSNGIESLLGPLKFLMIYMGSLIGGNLFALYIHRNHSDYRAVGASGAISGIVFATIALFPSIELGLLFIPFHIPGWAFGLFYVLYSIYGIKAQSDNIGHEAHLGGGLTGVFFAIGLVPQSLIYNYLPILLILVPSAIFIFLILKKPEILLFNNTGKKKNRIYTQDDKFKAEKKQREQEINLLLDKINEKGVDSLTQKERDTLNQYSN